MRPVLTSPSLGFPICQMGNSSAGLAGLRTVPGTEQEMGAGGSSGPAPSGAAAPGTLSPPTAAYGCRNRWKGQWLQTTRLLPCGSGDLKLKSAVSRAGSFWGCRERPFAAFPGFRRGCLPWLMACCGPRGKSSSAWSPGSLSDLCCPGPSSHSCPPGTSWRQVAPWEVQKILPPPDPKVNHICRDHFAV